MSLHRPSVFAFSSSKDFFSSSDSSMFKPSLVAHNNFLPSNSFNCWTQYSSMGSTMYKTSKPFFFNFSKNGLVFLHAGDVFLQRDLVVAGLGTVVTQEFGQLGSVGAVFVDTELDVLGERFVELLVVIFVFGDVEHQVDGLLDQVLLNDAQDLVLLQGFAGNVQGQVFTVDNPLDERKPFGHQVFAVVHDEDAADVQADVVLLFAFAFEHVKRGTLG